MNDQREHYAEANDKIRGQLENTSLLDKEDIRDDWFPNKEQLKQITGDQFAQNSTDLVKDEMKNGTAFDLTEKPGYCWLMNQSNDRPGSYYDVLCLNKLMSRQFGMKIKDITDCRADHFNMKLKKLVESDKMRNYSCFVLFLLAHGDKDDLEMLGTKINLQTDVLRVIGNWPAMSGKPKIILVGACENSDEKDFGLENDNTIRTASKLPQMRNIYLLRATHLPVSAKRHTQFGTLFIQAFCEVAKREAHRFNLDKIRQHINRIMPKIAIVHEEHDTLQMCSVRYNTLERTFYFLSRAGNTTSDVLQSATTSTIREVGSTTAAVHPQQQPVVRSFQQRQVLTLLIGPRTERIYQLSTNNKWYSHRDYFSGKCECVAVSFTDKIILFRKRGRHWNVVTEQGNITSISGPSYSSMMCSIDEHRFISANVYSKTSGCGSVSIMDKNMTQLARLPDIQYSSDELWDYTGLCCDSEELFVVGEGPGRRPHTAVRSLRLDEANPVWRYQPDLIQARSQHSAVMVEKSVYALAGHGGRDVNALTSVEQLDRRVGRWNHVARMGQKRQWFGVAVFKNEIWVAGGKDWSKGNCLDSVEVFCPRTNSFRWDSSIPEPNLHMGMVGFSQFP